MQKDAKELLKLPEEKTKVSKSAIAKKVSTSKKKSSSTVTEKKTNVKTKNSTKSKALQVKKKTVTPKYSALLEYYDLPYQYNQTTVKILAQTPNMLFIYWEISEEDKKSYISQYGEYFFNNTKPVLKIYNETMHYSFEVAINDFANSWYLPINDSNCKYHIELGRRPINNHIAITNNYLQISASNSLESPNDHVLISPNVKQIRFQNVKTSQIEEKEISSFLPTFNCTNKFPSIYSLYQEMYPKEWKQFINSENNSTWNFPLTNTSSEPPKNITKEKK